MHARGGNLEIIQVTGFPQNETNLFCAAHLRSACSFTIICTFTWKIFINTGESTWIDQRIPLLRPPMSKQDRNDVNSLIRHSLNNND